MAEAEHENPSAESPAAAYDPYTPFVVDLAYENGLDPPYEPFVIPENGRFRPSFILPDGVQANASSLGQLFLPDSLIDKMVSSTNAYAKSWLPPNKIRHVGRPEMLRFLAVIYYMGIVKLPAKKDYWRDSQSTVWPTHPVCGHISRALFEYIWRNVHFTAVETDLVWQEAEAEATQEEEEESAQDNTGNVEDVRWFEKARYIVEHMNRVSQSVCRHPSFSVSVDEQMKRFKGRSKETHRMKNKPIKEGYKFYAVCCAQTGYVFNCIPDGRGQREGTIGDTVKALLESLPQRGNLQYVCGMDNLFTTRQVMTESRSLGVGVVGTARARRGWPPKEIKQVSDERFNTFYLLKDQANYLIGRWVDNNIVTMVSTLHTGREEILRFRRRPRTTTTNRHHINRVWGDQSIKEINIPKVIDDYNHWMLGVDKSDQLIAYYRPDLRCRRVWMPIMLHCFDVMRVNAFIVAKENNNGKPLLHKEFIEDWIESLLFRAGSESIRSTRRRSPVELAPKKRRRVSTVNPCLPGSRLFGDRKDHAVGMAKKQHACAYCSYLMANAKKNKDDEVPKVSRVIRMCTTCNVFLCKAHFDVYHGWNEAEAEEQEHVDRVEV